MHRRRLLSAALVVPFLLGGTACRRNAPPVTPAAVSVITVQPSEQTHELTASGVIEAIDQAQVGFMVPGRIEAIDVEDGATVQSGQVLARLAAADFRNEAAIADAKLAEISARHARLTQMHELGSLTATDFERSSAALSEAGSAADLAHRRLAYAELRAPFAGRVVRHGVGVGSVVAPGLPVVTVVSLAPVWARLSVPEVDAPRLQPGRRAVVTLASNERTSAESTIEAILPQAEALTRSFAVKVRLTNPDGAFRPGNVVMARISTGERSSVVLLPPDVVQRFPDGALFTWVVEPESRAVTRRIVTVGRASGAGVEILTGLAAGDRVVRPGAAPLFDGMPVEITPR